MEWVGRWSSSGVGGVARCGGAGGRDAERGRERHFSAWWSRDVCVDKNMEGMRRLGERRGGAEF